MYKIAQTQLKYFYKLEKLNRKLTKSLICYLSIAGKILPILLLLQHLLKDLDDTMQQ